MGYEVEVVANDGNEKFNEMDERKVPQTFNYNYDYDELYQFLNISEKDFNSEWKKGKTITEIARERDISHHQLTLYLAEKQFEALEKALDNGEIDRYYYYDYAISYMKSDIMEFINRNPNKQET